MANRVDPVAVQAPASATPAPAPAPTESAPTPTPAPTRRVREIEWVTISFSHPATFRERVRDLAEGEEMPKPAKDAPVTSKDSALFAVKEVPVEGDGAVATHGWRDLVGA